MADARSFLVDSRANATLDAWKRATLQDAIQAAADAAAALGSNGVAVPPAYLPIAVAQFLLESAWGRSQLAQLGRNYFGIKARDGDRYIEFPTIEHVHGQDVTVRARFRRFTSMAECFVAHARLLCTAKPYAAARVHGDDPAAFAHALTGVYATDPAYGDKLIAVMQSRGLLRTFGFLAPEIAR